MRRPKLPRPSLRRKRKAAAEAPTELAATPGSEPEAQPQPVVRPLDPHERIDGLRSWLAQVDRKLGVRTYALGAACVLALAAGAVGIVLALSVQRDAATDDELATLRKEVAAAKHSATQEAEQSVQSINARLEQLEADFGELTSDQKTTEREVSVVQGDIRDLQDQVSSLRSSSSGGGGNGGGSP